MTSILITGGTGTFGRAFTQKLLDDGHYDRICIYSRGEHAQASMREEIGNDDRLRFFIGDVRDQARLKRAMNGVATVVHAAALKRIEVGAYNPIEMARTNVDGAANVVEAAQDAGVGKVVMLSTDKAYAPVSPYGHSKALAESVMLAANNTGATRFAVCRYGNVWNAQGSVIPRWRALIERGARLLPVTDPECTRFFMSAEDAVELVLKTIRVMQGGELVVPNLDAYRLGDLVAAIGAAPAIIGLPAWEKRHESMIEGASSADARRMTIAELRAELAAINFPMLALAEAAE